MSEQALKSVSPAYWEAKRRAAAVQADRETPPTVAEQTFKDALAAEVRYRLRRRRKFSWNPFDWIDP